jgi:hypothetical protein
VAQQNDLQEQLQQLKQQYEQTTREMQQRISTLEQQITEQKASEKAEGTVSSVRLAAEQAAKRGSRTIHQVEPSIRTVAFEPTYDLLNEAESKISRLQEQLGPLSSWYFRSGYGLNEGRIASRVSGSGADEVSPGQRSGNLRRIHFRQQLAEPGTTATKRG